MSTEGVKAEVKPKSLTLLVVAVFYVSVGLADLALLVTSKFTLSYIGLLGGLNLAAAAGLLLLKKWGLYLTYVNALLGGVVGLVTIYASVMFAGSFTPDTYSLTLNLVLVGYVAMVTITILYLLRQKRKFS